MQLFIRTASLVLILIYSNSFVAQVVNDICDQAINLVFFLQFLLVLLEDPGATLTYDGTTINAIAENPLQCISLYGCASS